LLHITERNSSGINPLDILLLTVFAIYNLPRQRSNQDFIGLSSLYFKSQIGKKTLKIPLNEISKVVIEHRRKLAPLVSGGIITSLALLSILLYSSSLEVVAIVAAGLLLTYYGMQEYLVIHMEHTNHTELIWLPNRVSLESVRPLVGILEYYTNKQQFPILYAINSKRSNSQIIHYEGHVVKSSDAILFSFANHQIEGNQAIAIKPELLDSPIIIYGEAKFIGQGENLINQSALIENNTISYS
jgi:hypothetical protein